jgi:hypothetical protein
MNEKYHLLTVYGDVEPVLTGPFDTKDKVLAVAKKHRDADPGMDDGLFIMTISTQGPLYVEAFSGGDFEK